MKQLTILFLLGFSAVANACSWNNIHLSYADSCKNYQFEVSGSGDSCFQVEVKIYKGNVLKATKTDKHFNYNFQDTGAYVVRTYVKNNCTNCDTVIYTQLQVSCNTNSSGCTWNGTGIYFGKSSSDCKKYTFELSSYDTCLKYLTMIYKNGVYDTISDNRVFTYTFSDTGKYHIVTKYKNQCTNCDTTISKLIEVECNQNTRCNWTKQGIYFNKNSNNCKKYVFEMGSYDSCIKYVNMIYKNGSYDTISDDRVFTYTFSDTGRYYIVTKFINQCSDCDTTISKLIEVECNQSNGCTWANQGIYYNQITNNCKKFIFELGSKDTCISYTTLAIRDGRIDTLSNARVFDHVFESTGYYWIRTTYRNKCTGCDTTLYKQIYVGCEDSCSWSNVGVGYQKNCNKFKFEVSDFDTCLSYTTFAIKGNTLDTLSHNRVFDYVFADTGYYSIRTSYFNKCTNCDTVIYKQVHIECLLAGVDELNIQAILAYPNPADKTIKFSDFANGKSFTLYNLQGVVLHKGVCLPDTLVDVSSLPQGVYILQIDNSFQRVVINHP